jgi:pSer/pThr/pTyr-binding forkhead associated (FHA) protein
VNNQFVVTDLHSLNGTYLGIEKIDCKTNPKQTVKDNDLIFLGREPFIIKLVFSVSINENSFIQENDDIVKYKCKKCDFISIDNSKICSGCNSYMNSQDWELCDND